MKVVLKERASPEEMFTVIHQEGNVATDCADHLMNQNQKAEPAGSGANAQSRRNLHAAATFFCFFVFFSCRFGCIFLGGVV